jgi:DNA polymerase-3 subunit delta'
MIAPTPLPWAGPVRDAVSALRRRGAHAVLLHGPAGTGKFETALSIARDELCETSKGEGPACGACASCLLFAVGNHPDLRVLVPDSMAERRPGGSTEEDEEAPGAEDEASRVAAAAASGTGSGSKKRPSRELRIEQVRDLSKFEELTTHRAGMRVVVLGPAEALNVAAANALLKGLEEPPPGSLFLLTSDHVDRCLPTILSRCAIVRMAVPAHDVALNWLRTQGVADAGQKLTEAGGAPLAVLRKDDQALGEADYEALLSMLRRGQRLDPAEVATRVSRNIPLGAAVALMQRWGWDYISHQLAGRVRYHPGDSPAFEAIATAGWPLPAAGAWLDQLRDLRAVADHPLNARLAVEGALLDYMASLQGKGRT